MTVFRAATLRTFFFAFHAGAKELKFFLQDQPIVSSVVALFLLSQVSCLPYNCLIQPILFAQQRVKTELFN